MRRTARRIVGNAGPGVDALPNVVERRNRVNRPGRHGMPSAIAVVVRYNEAGGE
jgi:hypothetical protein